MNITLCCFKCIANLMTLFTLKTFFCLLNWNVMLLICGFTCTSINFCALYYISWICFLFLHQYNAI